MPTSQPCCSACGREGALDKEHIFNRGVKRANGCDCPSNITCLCRRCHSMAHAKGKRTFYQTMYPHLQVVYLVAEAHYHLRCAGLGCGERHAPARELKK